MSALNDAVIEVKARWARLQARERTFLLVGGALLLGSAVWWLLLAQPIAWLRQAPVLHAKADAERSQMQSLAAQAKAIQGAPRVTAGDALKVLEATVKDRFGATAELRVIGERATLTLKGASPQAVADFMAVARTEARALVSDARLMRSSASAAAPSWDGSLTLTIFAAP